MSSQAGGLNRSQAPFLTVDVGNSAVKLRVWSTPADGAPTCVLRAEIKGDSHEAFPATEFFRSAGALELAAISSVASAEITSHWCEHIERATGVRAFLDLDAGLDNRTYEPRRVGRDRLFAARGALEWIGESAVVIDVGTALTVDALLADGAPPQASGWKRGAFLGGAIAPGPTMLAHSLGHGAARLFEVVPQPDPPALGRDTAAALRSGIGVGLRGAVRELAREVAREAGLVDPPIALTGGARAFARSAFSARRVFESEDLVHLGLCAALLEHAGRKRPQSFGPR